MSGIETYGGACPHCLKAMEQKWNSSYEGLLFDACIWCGFISWGSLEPVSKEETEDVWNEILSHSGVKSREDFIKKYSPSPYVTSEKSDFYPSIFDYSDDEGTSELYKLLWLQSKRHNSEEIGGRRVMLKEKPEQKGTIIKYDEEGTLYVQWDKHKHLKRFPQRYEGLDLGNKLLLVST